MLFALCGDFRREGRGVVFWCLSESPCVPRSVKRRSAVDKRFGHVPLWSWTRPASRRFEGTGKKPGYFPRNADRSALAFRQVFTRSRKGSPAGLSSGTRILSDWTRAPRLSGKPAAANRGRRAGEPRKGPPDHEGAYLLPARKYSERPQHLHDGKVNVMRSGLRSPADSEQGRLTGSLQRRVHVPLLEWRHHSRAFLIDAHDRKIQSPGKRSPGSVSDPPRPRRAVVGAGISTRTSAICCPRLTALRTPSAIEVLTDRAIEEPLVRAGWRGARPISPEKRRSAPGNSARSPARDRPFPHCNAACRAAGISAPWPWILGCGAGSRRSLDAVTVLGSIGPGSRVATTTTRTQG